MKKDFDTTKAMLEAEACAFYNSLQTSVGKQIDESFAREDDEPLTDDEIRQIDEYWGKYSFAYPEIDYKSFQTFKNRLGRFDVRHCPGNVRTNFFSPRFKNMDYFYPMQHKAMVSYIYPDIKHPDTVISRMNDITLDSDFKPTYRQKAVETIVNYVKNVNSDGVVFKMNKSSGGKGVTVIKGEDVTPERIDSEILKAGLNAFVVQGFLRQSEFMAQLHKSSVNTIRITTLIHKRRASVIAAVVRAGDGDSMVDNWCSGGVIIGVDKETGKLNDWALSNDNTRITALSNGFDLSQGEYYIPDFENVKNTVVACHYRCPYIKMISWDIALDENNEPTLIECNFSGMMQIHEAVTGPLFADCLDELLDLYLLKWFSLKFAEDNFIAKEYHDHVTIAEYIGDETEVVIPDTLKGKPVTMIEKNAFKGMNISAVSASEDVINSSKQALSLVERVNIK